MESKRVLADSMIKQDHPGCDHLEWLVKSRGESQRVALEIFKLFEKYPKKLENRILFEKANDLVAVSFSLWRAAFLADKTGSREAVFKDAKAFLAKMLVDNAITYAQDRSSREWTFNYYMGNAREGLSRLAKRWPDVEKVFQRERTLNGASTSQHRWNRRHKALEQAVENFANDLEGDAL